MSSPCEACDSWLKCYTTTWLPRVDFQQSIRIFHIAVTSRMAVFCIQSCVRWAFWTAISVIKGGWSFKLAILFPLVLRLKICGSLPPRSICVFMARFLFALATEIFFVKPRNFIICYWFSSGNRCQYIVSSSCCLRDKYLEIQGEACIEIM